MQLKALGIQATTLNHSTSKEEVKTIMQAITDPHSTLRLLYVTPEKLAQSKRLMNKLEKCDEAGLLKLVAIDEVHCCSQWGHDFRPDFKFLNVVKRQFKDVPIVGLTATATYDVVEDLKNILNIPAAVVFRAGFNRPNLFYEVVPKPSKLEDSVADISAMIKNRFSGESGIVYCFSKKDCEELATALRQQGIQAHFYHADMDTEQRKRTHEKWTAGAINVMVATVAFGMGIDKPDVRYVIHHSLPKSMENYYQESGRAGRDGKDATCVLYFRLSDLFRQSTMVCTEKTGIANLYSMLVYCLQSKSCRRCLIAEHFNEVWNESWCSKKCDVCCGKTSSSTSVNIEPCLDIFIQLLKECEQKAKNESSRRITGLKLVELAMKRLKNDYSKTALEYAVAHFLRYGYLKEEFHFTPYSIVSYVVAGAKCLTGVQDNQESLTVQIPLNSGEANPVAAKPQISSRKRTAEIDGAVDKRRLINCASPEITEIVL
ncbi:hypothetical protein AB6A40_003087 [Gnathostoma spinigerum]|uniref:ATP-dependent DNA helicase n=1 Tax=Gnathostoma spinigerum TaxID=75299 RepID=A0ABD6EHE5_9BILA